MKLRYAFLTFFLFIIIASCAKDIAYKREDMQVLFVDDKENIAEESATNSSDVEIQLFDMINEHRLEANFSVLKFEEFTYTQAEKHTDYMISQGHRSHVNFAQRGALISKKIGAELVAENLASDYQTIEKAFEDWIKSSGHRQNIEGDFTHTGLSIKADANGMLYFTQIFYK